MGDELGSPEGFFEKDVVQGFSIFVVGDLFGTPVGLFEKDDVQGFCGFVLGDDFSPVVLLERDVVGGF